MENIQETIFWFARTPSLRLLFPIILVLSYFLGKPVAKKLGWQKWGTRLTLASLGSILIVTFVSRIGYYDLSLNRLYCDNTISGSWFTPETILNLVLTIPLGIGLYAATHALKTSIFLILVTVVLIEFGQAISGLGSCQDGDILRNSIGGVFGIVLCYLVYRIFGKKELENSL